jgi:hypothetical protein
MQLETTVKGDTVSPLGSRARADGDEVRQMSSMPTGKAILGSRGNSRYDHLLVLFPSSLGQLRQVIPHVPLDMGEELKMRG